MIADVAMVVSELIETFSTSTVTVKLQWYFPTLALTYQLRSFQFHFELSHPKLPDFSFLPTAFSNFTYPFQT